MSRVFSDASKHNKQVYVPHRKAEGRMTGHYRYRQGGGVHYEIGFDGGGFDWLPLDALVPLHRLTAQPRETDSD